MQVRKLKRREFLRLTAASAAGVTLVACQPQTVIVKETVEVEKEVTKVIKETIKETVIVEGTPQIIEKEVTKVVEATAVPEEHEAPDLLAQVQAGTLPALDERIPIDPLIITPYEQVGKYGGTWHRFDTSSDGSHVAMAMYGYSIVHWVQDGLDKRGGLCKDWVSNDAKTEWTFNFRKGTKWSDGEPFTVDDILFWWEDMALNEEHPDSPPDWSIAGGETMELEKIDDFTIKFTYAGVAPLLDSRLAMWPNSRPGMWALVPKHYLEQFHPDHSQAYDTFETYDENIDWRVNPDCPVLNAWKPVEAEPSVRLQLERNPFNYATDNEGNQLPYIDKVDVTYVENNEVSKLKVLAGEQEICGRPCRYYPLEDLSLLRSNEVSAGYRVLLWDVGGGAASLFYPSWNQPDPDKQALYRNATFRKALSHAMDRPKIQKIVFFGTGVLSQATFSPKAVEYHRTEEGREIYKAWRDCAVEFDPEKAMSMLDEIGVVDTNGDGYREMPGGKELELRIDMSATTGKDHVLTAEIVQENWEAVGLKTILNPIPGEQIGVLQDAGEIDVRNSWGLGDGPDHLVFPHWLVPIDNNRWAPLYGAWYKVKGTEKEGTELDKDPRERNPPREEPPVGGPVARLQELYDQAKVEPDWKKRDELVIEMIKIHIEDGPFILGTVANQPCPIVIKNNVGNVPTKQQLGQGGFCGPWIMVYFGAVYPEQFYYKDV